MKKKKKRKSKILAKYKFQRIWNFRIFSFFSIFKKKNIDLNYISFHHPRFNFPFEKFLNPSFNFFLQEFPSIRISIFKHR